MVCNVLAHKFDCLVGNNIFLDDTEKHTYALDNGLVGGFELFAFDSEFDFAACGKYAERRAEKFVAFHIFNGVANIQIAGGSFPRKLAVYGLINQDVDVLSNNFMCPCVHNSTSFRC